MIKKGDKVRVWDNSFSLKVVNGDLSYFATPGGNINMESPIYEVKETNLKLPADNRIPTTNSPVYNDTIIKKNENGDMYFIRECQLKKVDNTQRFIELEEGQAHKYNVDGRDYYYIKVDSKRSVVMSTNHFGCDYGEIFIVKDRNIRVTPVEMEELLKNIKESE